MTLLARQLKGPQIAERLGISSETVRTHVDNSMHGLIDIPIRRIDEGPPPGHAPSR